MCANVYIVPAQVEGFRKRQRPDEMRHSGAFGQE